MRSRPAKSFFQAAKSLFLDTYSHHASAADYFSVSSFGLVDHLIVAQKTADIIEAVKLADQFDLDFQIIGGGTSSLMSSVGYSGLLIVDRTRDFHIFRERGQVVVSGGYPVAELINRAATYGLGGCEWLSSVPGTVAGAIMTNCHRERVEFLSFVKEITVLGGNVKNRETLTLTPDLKWLSENRSITLTAKIQFTRLAEDEIRRRIGFSRRSVVEPKGVLGYLYPEALPDKEIKKIFAKKAWLNKKDPQVIHFEPSLSTAQVLNLLRSVERVALGDQAVERRLRIVGYWPDETEDGLKSGA